MKIVTAEEMRRIDQRCIDNGTPAHVLMENAGRAVALETQRFLGSVEDKFVLCLCGGGNNGGDGLVAARYLHDNGAQVAVFLCSSRDDSDENLRLLKEKDVSCSDISSGGSIDEYKRALKEVDCVIDALLGTGRGRPLEGLMQEVLSALSTEREQRVFAVVAVDVPSGMDANTGACDPACPVADLTVTLALPKPGLYGYPGVEKTGELVIADIGIPNDFANSSTTELITRNLVSQLLPSRPLGANKGTFGKALVIAGSVNYTGAAFLACGGALRAGAGLVTLAAAASLHPIIAARLAEVTHLPLAESPAGYIAAEAFPTISEAYSSYSALLAGCGLGQMPSTAAFIRSLLSSIRELPCILDADALNIIATIPNWYRNLQMSAVLTPHPGEMARLTGLTTAAVQQDRLGNTRRFSEEWQQVVVLKGAHTVIASPEGSCRISPFANPVLATGGTGDILAGIITGLAAQGLTMFDAATLGVYLHGEAAQQVSRRMGNIGMIASDLLPELPMVMNTLANS